MLKDVNIGSNGSYPKGFTLAGNTLYFWADDGAHGLELWKTDGTLNGTVLVSDINTGANDSINQNFESTVVGDTMYFAADNGLNGIELWKSNGTSTGTMLVKDIKSKDNSQVLLHLVMMISSRSSMSGWSYPA